MTFISLSKVEDPETLLDMAFRAARERRDFAHKDIKGRSDITRLKKSQRAEQQRVYGAGRTLKRQLDTIITAYPSINNLPAFYQEIIQTVVSVDELKHAIGAVHWAMDKIDEFTTEYGHLIGDCHDLTKINALRRAYYGRCASTLKRVKKELAYLEVCRKAFKDLPSLKTSMPTVVIAGVPNVGKSTLLHALTGAKPEIKPYPFTTKHLMLGYATIGEQELQFIDTPGLLDRPQHKRNTIEARAALAVKHLANVVLFVIDPTGHCGFSMDEQLRLLKDIQEDFNTPIIVLINKADVGVEYEKFELPKKLVALRISAKNKQGIDEALAAITNALS